MVGAVGLDLKYGQSCGTRCLLWPGLREGPSRSSGAGRSRTGATSFGWTDSLRSCCGTCSMQAPGSEALPAAETAQGVSTPERASVVGR